MKKYLVILLLGIISCSSPIDKLLKTPELSPRDKDKAALFCEIHFKKIESPVVEGKPDSTSYKQYIETLTSQYEQLIGFYNTMSGLKDSTDNINDSLKLVMSSVIKSKTDSLNGIIKALKKGIPCPTKTDTIKIIDPATVRNFNNAIIELNSEIATIKITNVNLKAENSDFVEKNKVLQKEKNKGWYYFYGLLAFVALLIGLTIYLKIKKLFIFI